MKTTTLLLLSILFVASCSKDEGGKCYDFKINHQVVCTPNNPDFDRANETYVETKCSLEDDEDALRHAESIEDRGNDKNVGAYIYSETFTVIKITEKK